MIFREYSVQNEDTVMLLHGGGLSWWQYQEEAGLLADRYHVVLPVLDGHAGSERPFVSIAANADDLLKEIDCRWGGRVLFIGGLSLGGQVLLEMLAKRSSVCRFALVESAMAYPSPVTHELVGPAFGCSYGLIRRRWFARMQFRSLHLKPEWFEQYYRDTCLMTRENLVAMMKGTTSYAPGEAISHCGAEVSVVAGSRETPGILRSARIIAEMIPASSLNVLPGYRHGDFSIHHAEDYCRTIEAMIRGGGCRA